MQEQEYSAIFNYLQARQESGGKAGVYPLGWLKSTHKNERRALRMKCTSFSIENGALFKEVSEVLHSAFCKYCSTALVQLKNKTGNSWRKVVKSIELTDVLNKFHNDPATGGHRKVLATMEKITNYYWFPNMTEIVKAWIADCVCQHVSLLYCKMKTSSLRGAICRSLHHTMQLIL